MYATPGLPGTLGGDSVRMVIATPLNDVNSTLNRLAMLELLVGLIVLAVVAAIAFWLVGRELRPLCGSRTRPRPSQAATSHSASPRRRPVPR